MFTCIKTIEETQLYTLINNEWAQLGSTASLQAQFDSWIKTIKPSRVLGQTSDFVYSLDENTNQLVLDVKLIVWYIDDEQLEIYAGNGNPLLDKVYKEITTIWLHNVFGRVLTLGKGAFNEHLITHGADLCTAKMTPTGLLIAPDNVHDLVVLDRALGRQVDPFGFFKQATAALRAGGRVVIFDECFGQAAKDCLYRITEVGLWQLLKNYRNVQVRKAGNQQTMAHVMMSHGGWYPLPRKKATELSTRTDNSWPIYVWATGIKP